MTFVSEAIARLSNMDRIMNRSFFFREQETYKVSEEQWLFGDDGFFLGRMKRSLSDVNIWLALGIGISACGKLALFASVNRQSEFPIDKMKIKGSLVFKKKDAEDFESFEGDRSEFVEASRIEDMFEIVYMMGNDYNRQDFLKEHLHSGFLTIKTEVEICWRKSEFRELKLPRDTSKKLASDLASLLTSPLTKDYMVVCQGEEFPCHRAVLEARSDTFKGGLNEGMMEGAQGR